MERGNPVPFDVSGRIEKVTGVPATLFTSRFMIACTSGCSAHVVGRREDGRAIRSSANYIGLEEQVCVPIAER